MKVIILLAKKYCIFLLTFLLLLVTFSYWFVLSYIPKHQASYYVNLVKVQEADFKQTDKDVGPSKGDILYFEKCPNVRKNLCFKDFYEKYTVKYGSEKAMLHLLKLISYGKGRFIGYMHMGTHGIGYGEYTRKGVDLALLELDSKDFIYYNQFLTGYTHGVIEKFMSGTVDTEDFKERLKKICYTENFYGNFKNTCFHGAGHAILNEFGYDLQKSLDFCKEISPSESKLAYCSFGVFMELYLNLPDIEFDMKFCDSQNLLYRTSCYLEYSRNLSKKIKNIETSADAVDACKTIKEDVYRLACIKFHARNFLSFDYYDNPKQMCQVQTQTNSEKIICTATYAATLGMALTKDDNSRRYKHIVSDICKTLPFYQSGKCSDLIAEKKLYMNYTTAKDLSM